MSVLASTDWVDWVPTTATVLGTIALILVARALFRRSQSTDHAVETFRAQLVTIVITIVGLMVAILTLPSSIDSELALGAVGLLFTGILAISSQSIISNAMAGLMLRSVAGFRPGDFIEVAGHMGRVSERGLFHTEIQTPDRDLVTLPNSLMVTEPVKVVRGSGTIVSMQVSIGYDVSRHILEPLFAEAAERAGLLDPFIQILELGDHSVQYRIAGFLEDPRNLITARSRLRAAVLDSLSEANVEIMSPWYVARRDAGARPVVPHHVEPVDEAVDSAVHERIFDKAEAAGQLEVTRSDLADARRELEILESDRSGSDADSRSIIDARIARQRRRIASLEEAVDALADAYREE